MILIICRLITQLIDYNKLLLTDGDLDQLMLRVCVCVCVCVCATDRTN